MRHIDRKTPAAAAFAATVGLAATMGLAACNAPDSQERQASAQDLRSSEATQTDEAGIFPDAPSDRVRNAVRESALEVEEGEASFYADTFEGRRTASGRTFRQREMVAAHRAFPFGTRLLVTNVGNGNEVEVTVVDRGPFGGTDVAPVIDLSRMAAERLDFIGSGRTAVRVEVLEWGSGAA